MNAALRARKAAKKLSARRPAHFSCSSHAQLGSARLVGAGRLATKDIDHYEHIMASSPATRSEILSLYRRCLRSMMRIPDAEQREVYKVYVRDGFRSKSSLLPGCQQATHAQRDAKEQLERMDYYHSIRERKANDQQQQSEEVMLDSNGNGNGNGNGTLGEQDVSTVGEKCAFFGAIGASQGEIDYDDTSTTAGTNRIQYVQRWLMKSLPHLTQKDALIYSKQFVRDGFDCQAMMEELIEEDLDFMKKAHRRALTKVLFSSRSTGDSNGDR